MPFEEMSEGRDGFKTKRKTNLGDGFFLQEQGFSPFDSKRSKIGMRCLTICLFEQTKKVVLRKAGFPSHIPNLNPFGIMFVNIALGGNYATI